jgi:adenylate cyclase
MSRSMLLELVRRRVPHVTGIYLAAGWGLLEFTDWCVVRFGLPDHIPDLVGLGWLALLPLVLWGSWRFGEALRFASPLPKVPAGGTRSVAVLPFANLSPAPEDEFLSHGLSDEIISALAKVDGLKVVARTSTLPYRDSPRDIREIGRALDAQAVLEGSVQRAGNRLRVTTQLINVADGYHLWTERFDRQMEDVVAIEDEIAENVARALRVILRDGELATLARVPTADVRAYEFYLRGRQFFYQTRKKSLE